MSVFAVYESSTGNVVGAVKALDVPVPAADALVGAALPVRLALDAGVVAVLSLPGRDLAVHEADDQPDVFVEPLVYGVKRETGQPPKPALATLGSLDAPTFDPTGLLVVLPGATSEKLAVYALVSEGTETLAVTAVIKEGADRVSIPVSVSTGQHAVLLLVAGRKGRLDKVTK